MKRFPRMESLFLLSEVENIIDQGSEMNVRFRDRICNAYQIPDTILYWQLGSCIVEGKKR